MKIYSPSVSGLATAVLLFAPLASQAQNAPAAADAAVAVALEESAARAAQAAQDAAEAAAAATLSAEASAESTDTRLATACAGGTAAWLGDDSANAQLDGREAPWLVDLRGSEAQGRMFRLSEPATVRLETMTKNNGDPVLHLLDASGTTIAESDDAASSYNSQIVTDLDAGDYCVTADDMRNRMDLTLMVGLEAHDSILVANELACGPQTQAQDLRDKDLSAYLAKGPLTYQSDATGNGYVKFTTTGSEPLSLRATAGDSIDPMITLFDESGQQIASNNDADGVNARLDFLTGLPSGSYCIGVRSAAPADGKITLNAQVLDVETYKRAAYERGELAPLDGSYPLHPLIFNRQHGEIILQGNAVTWMEFDLKERSVIALRTLGTPSGADTMLSLFDESGELLVQVDDTDNSRNAAISPMVLQKGRYLVSLSDRASSAQFGAPLRPVVLVADRYLRAPQD